jgi:hypothetical protein
MRGCVSKDGQEHRPFIVAVLRDALALLAKAPQDEGCYFPGTAVASHFSMTPAIASAFFSTIIMWPLP